MWKENDAQSMVGEEAYPALGESGKYGILLALGENYYEEFVPWLEEIVQKAYRLGLEPYSWDLNRFIEEDLELVIDPYEFEGGMPGTAATFLYAWGFEDEKEAVISIAKKAFSRLAKSLKPDMENIYEGTRLYFVGLANGEKRWSQAFNSWSDEKLCRFREWLIEYDRIESIETDDGTVEVFWSEDSIECFKEEFEADDWKQ